MLSETVIQKLDYIASAINTEEMAYLLGLLMPTSVEEIQDKNLGEDGEILVSNTQTKLMNVPSNGYIEEKMINGCGPYRYLRYREDGKLKSKYLGKGGK